MAWRDELRPGKFRNAGFKVEDSDRPLGRRVVVHEYPKRDDVDTDDLGKRVTEFTIECYVLGENYMADRDALIEALNQEGPGILQHPYYGNFSVIVTDARVRENAKDGGIAYFTITFVEYSEPDQPSVVDTAIFVDEAADAAITTAKDDFADKYSLLKLSESLVKEVQKEIDRVILNVKGTTSDVAVSVANLVRSPFNLASSIVSAVQTVTALAEEPRNALNLYKGSFNPSTGAQAFPITIANRKTQAKSVEAVQQLVRRVAVVESVRSTSQVDFQTSNDASAVRDILLAELDSIEEFNSKIDSSMPTAEFLDSIVALRAAFAKDMFQRALKLPKIINYTPMQTLPALVIAHHFYYDAAREAEIVLRNNVRHPGFVPGGVSLEVLSDV